LFRSPGILFVLLLFLGVLALSTSAIFVKLSSAPAPVTAFYRMFFSTMLLLPVIFFQKTVYIEIRKLTGKQWSLVILSGATLAVHYILWFESLQYTSIASSTVLVTLQPLFAFIGGYLLYGEKLKGLAVGGGILSIAGSIIIGWGDFQTGEEALFGDMLALLGAAAITAFFLTGQYVRKSLSLIPYALLAYAASSIFLLGYSYILKYPLTGYSSSDWLWFFCLALVPTLLGQTIFNWLIKWVNTSTISMSILGEPVGTCILAYFIFGETVTQQQIAGSIVIFAGIFIFLRFNKPASVSSNNSDSKAV
jgi:drug/metabolite transporter (DMT)-like permease